MAVRTALVILLFVCASAAFAVQDATLTRNAPLRAQPSSPAEVKAHLTASTQVTLPASARTAGYYHVQTGDGTKGWVWAKSLQLGSSEPGSTSNPDHAANTPASIGNGQPGSTSTEGCGDHLWEHVYNPSRLIVKNGCLTVTGVIVDATAKQSTHHADGVRHEGDGDTHGWLKVDPQFENLLNDGNRSNEGGNLVFELVWHFRVTQQDAKSPCVGFKDTTVIPPVGTHVAIKGTFVEDTNHARWNEIHPVSSTEQQP